MPTSSLRSPKFWLGIAVSLLCLLAIFFFIEPAEIVEALRSADFRYLLLCALCLAIYLGLRALRWRFMLNNDVGLARTFHIQNIGFMMTQLLPLRIGDPARAILIGNEPKLSVGRGFSTLIVERILDLLVVVALLPFGLTQVPSLPDWVRTGALATGVLALVAIGFVILAANLRPKVRQLTSWIFDRIPFLTTETWVSQIDELLAGLVSLTNWRSGSILILLSILPWVLVIFAYQAAMVAVGLAPNLLMSAFVVCAAAFAIAAPSSPGQVGVFHAGATLAVTSLGMDGVAGASFAFLYHVINFTVTVILGILGLWLTQATFGRIVDQTRALIRTRNSS